MQTSENPINSIPLLSKEEERRLFAYNDQEQRQELARKPWLQSPHHFKSCQISALALLKMTQHTAQGGNIEVMGLMQGKIMGDTVYVMDAFALPVEGTETRVNAQQEGYEYMVQYVTSSKAVGRLENVVGWYHSHPGYGCWLSGIDVATQSLNQQYQEPFVAVVIDPLRTVSGGHVEIGAFRTLPESAISQQGDSSALGADDGDVPLEKIEDFGVHCRRYYQLDVSYFKSNTDAKLLQQLWTGYWSHVLANVPSAAVNEHHSKTIIDYSHKCCRLPYPAHLLLQKQMQNSSGTELVEIGGGGSSSISPPLPKRILGMVSKQRQQNQDRRQDVTIGGNLHDTSISTSATTSSQSKLLDQGQKVAIESLKSHLHSLIKQQLL